MNALTIILGLLVAITFIGFIIYAARGKNLLMGLFVMAVLWFLFGTIYDLAATDGARFNIIMENLWTVFHDGPVDYGQTTAIIIFASWFGRVLVDTGIASALIKRVVELAGDQQLVVVLVVSLLTAGLFMSIFGPGSVMAIGQIILPIFFSIGVNTRLAIGAFIMAVASGMYVNGGYISQFSGHEFFAPLFNENIGNFNQHMTTFTWLASSVHMIIMVLFILFTYYRTKDSVRTWAMPVDEGEKDVPSISLIVPFIPVLLSLTSSIIRMWYPDVIEFSAIFNFIVGIFFGLLLTGHLKTYKKALETTQKTLQNGISDVALLIGMLLMMNTFSKAAGLISPIISSALGDSLNWIVEKPLLIVLIFMALVPLAYFRGPMMIWGSGIALASVINAVLTGGNPELTGTFPLLLVLFYVQPVGLVANSCPTQSWNMWALSYSKFEANEFIKTQMPWSWAISAINIFLAYLILM